MAGPPGRIVIASDHAGVELKRRLVQALAEAGIQAEDLGTGSTASVDYPDFAAAVADRISRGAADTGVLVCGTGLGMAMTANKFAGVRAAVLYDDASTRLARQHNDANVAVFGARTMSAEDAVRRLRIFLEEAFEGGRHGKRLSKIRDIERKNSTGNGPGPEGQGA